AAAGPDGWLLPRRGGRRGGPSACSTPFPSSDPEPSPRSPRPMARSSSEAIRRALGHPVVDCDGHLVEVVPHYLDTLKTYAGAELAERFGMALLRGPTWLGPDAAAEERRWWEGRRRTGARGGSTRNTLDCAPPLLPRLLHSRMDELGIDFSI